MKSLLVFLCAVLVTTGTYCQETYREVKSTGRYAWLKNEKGHPRGTRIYGRGSIPAFDLLFADMNIPFSEYTILVPEEDRKPILIPRDSFFKAFYYNPNIALWGMCSEESVRSVPRKPNNTLMRNLAVGTDWLMADSIMILRVGYQLYDLETNNEGFQVTLLRKYDLLGNHLEDFILTGLGDGFCEITRDGRYLFLSLGLEGETGGMVCNDLGRVVFDLETRQRVFLQDYGDRFEPAETLIGAYSFDLKLSGNTLFEVYYPKGSEEGIKQYYRVIDFRNENKSYFFGLPMAAARTLHFHPDGISFLEPSGQRAYHKYGSNRHQDNFFYVTH